MRHIPLPTGPFKKWPFFKPEEIEQTASKTLRDHGLLPDSPGEILVDDLVDKLFGFTPDYCDPGEGILGYIKFGRYRPERIVIHESLADLENPVADQRRRSTLAHEIGHGQLHLPMFLELAQARESDHFSGDWVRQAGQQKAAFACRPRDIDEQAAGRNAPDGRDWHRMAEWQANRYMAGLLCPAKLIRQLLEALLGLIPGYSALSLNPKQCSEFAVEVARTFNVSRQLAQIRLAELFPANPQGQGDLFGAMTAQS